MGTQLLLIEVLSADAIEELIINLALEGLYVVQPPYQPVVISYNGNPFSRPLVQAGFALFLYILYVSIWYMHL